MAEDATTQTDGQATDATPETVEEKTLTQSEVNALIAREKTKAGKAALAAYKSEQVAEQAKSQQSAEQQAQAERDAADQRATDAEAKANAKIVRADAKSVAQTLDFRADRINEVLQFADLSDIAVNDDGDADTKAIEAALKPLLTRFPEWSKAETRDIGSGFNSGSDTSTTTTATIIPEANRTMNAAFRSIRRR